MKLVVYREDPDSPLPFRFVLVDSKTDMQDLADFGIDARALVGAPTAYGDAEGIVHAPTDEDFAAVAAAIDAMSDEEFALLCATPIELERDS
jgi:hypothetical protein